MNIRTFGRSRRVRRFFKGLLLVVIVLATIHGIATVILGRMLENRIQAYKAHGDPVSISDLIRPDIPDSENGALIYSNVGKKVYNCIREENTKWYAAFGKLPHNKQPVNPMFDARGVLSSSAQHGNIPNAWAAATDYVRSIPDFQADLNVAAAKPYCYFKLQQSGWVLYSDLYQLRVLVGDRAIRAVMAAKAGDMDRTMADITEASHLSNLGKDDPDLIGLNYAVECEGTVRGALSTIGDCSHLDAARAKALYNMLSDVDLRKRCTLAIKGERACGLWAYGHPSVLADQSFPGRSASSDMGYEDVFDYLADVPGSIRDSMRRLFFSRIVCSYLWRPMLYLEELNALDTIDRLIAFQSLPYREIKKRGYEARYQSEISRRPFYTAFAWLLDMNYMHYLAYRDVGTTCVRGNQIFLALLAYKDKFHDYPRTIHELRSKLGWKLHEDPFSGKDFVYKREGQGFLLYSIGENMKDEGGTHGVRYFVPGPYGPTPKFTDDITWSISH